jgi:hypothetical protein
MTRVLTGWALHLTTTIHAPQQVYRRKTRCVYNIAYAYWQYYHVLSWLDGPEPPVDTFEANISI